MTLAARIVAVGGAFALGSTAIYVVLCLAFAVAHVNALDLPVDMLAWPLVGIMAGGGLALGGLWMEHRR